MEDPVKEPWKSKTIWISLLVALSAFNPPIQKIISENPEVFSSAVGILFGLMRLISKDKIVIK